MLDYKGLEALYTIIKQQSFEKAADKLNISQPAISQRLTKIQNYYGDSLLIRSQPYRATKLGEKLLGHFMRVNQLETSLDLELDMKKTDFAISIAISRDSLETWFIKLIKQTDLFKDKIIEIIADDEEITLDYLQKGLVSACISTSDKPLINCEANHLGNLKYILVASKKFKQDYFGEQKITANQLLKAPAIIFDNNDSLHNRYLRKFFNIKNAQPHYHIIPSVQGFRQVALQGYAYALIPQIDVINELNTGKLINLCPEYVWEMPIYLHNWKFNYPKYRLFYESLITNAKKQLD